jgi:hypothetical protein
MPIDPQTALHQLRRLYRDAHHCDAPTDDHAREWARNPVHWATNQIRYRGWDFSATEATVREAKRLHNRLTVTAQREAQ